MCLGVETRDGSSSGDDSGAALAVAPIAQPTGEVLAHGDVPAFDHPYASLLIRAGVNPAELVSERPIEAAIR